MLPHRILTNIIETIYALDKVAPGTANDDTLLYGCESKYYSIRPVFMNEKFELTDNVYIIAVSAAAYRSRALWVFMLPIVFRAKTDFL